MRKEDIQEYLSDEALEALIRETEEGPMIKAPEYLEENILHKIEQHPFLNLDRWQCLQ